MNQQDIRQEEGKQTYYRDMLHTVDQRGKRKWIYPKRPSGKLYRARSVVAILLLAFFFAAPFIHAGGEPILLFNFFERRFILFGLPFYPQDFFLLALLLLTFIVFIILFTVIYGRIFCGWACPQTLFLEFLFRQVEYLFEGDYRNQKILATKDPDLEVVLRKGGKHLVFIFLSLFISHIVLSYILGAAYVWDMIAAGPLGNTLGFFVMLLLAGFIYFIYSSFREQVCIILCPYGRLQGVLLDLKSIVVAYDHKRGEPRAPARAGTKQPEAGNGDCIDCFQCVRVCPTGIDIRNGTQLECINCAACIDACNGVMKRMHRPPGLIRYDSESGINTGKRSILTARTMAYTVVLTILMSVSGYLLLTRSEVELTVLREPGTLYQDYGPDKLANLYSIQLVNKSRHDIPVTLKINPVEGEVIFIGEPLTAPAGTLSKSRMMIVMPRSIIASSNTAVQIDVYSGDKKLTGFKTNFIGPDVPVQ